LKVYTYDKLEKRKNLLKMNEFADEIYGKNLLKKAFEAVKNAQ